MVLCKGVAQDRLSSEQTTQMGLRPIVGCDKERWGRDQASQAALCKPNIPNKRDSHRSSHTAASGIVCQQRTRVLSGSHSGDAEPSSQEVKCQHRPF